MNNKKINGRRGSMDNYLGFQVNSIQQENSTSNKSQLSKIVSGLKSKLTSSTVSRINVETFSDSELFTKGLEMLQQGNMQQALYFLIAGAKRNNGACAMQLHDIYATDQYGMRDMEGAFFWARYAADCKDARGCYYTGLYYKQGTTVAVNKKMRGNLWSRRFVMAIVRQSRNVNACLWSYCLSLMMNSIMRN